MRVKTYAPIGIVGRGFDILAEHDGVIEAGVVYRQREVGSSVAAGGALGHTTLISRTTPLFHRRRRSHRRAGEQQSSSSNGVLHDVDMYGMIDGRTM